MHGPDASVDLTLDGGENRVDVDLFSETSVEHARVGHAAARDDDPLAATGESPGLPSKALDFVLDAPERGAEPPHAEPPHTEPAHEEPTVESEQMFFGDRPAAARASEEHTAEVDIHDLGFDVDHLEATDTPASVGAHLEKTDQSTAEAPTVESHLDDTARNKLAQADSSARDTDLTQLERELEASFIAELAASSDDIKESIVQESAPTVNMATGVDAASTGKFQRLDTASDTAETEVLSGDATAKMQGLNPDSIDLDFGHMADDLGPPGEDRAGPGEHDDAAAREAFDNSQRLRAVDLDLSEGVNRSAAIPNAMDTIETRQLVVKSSESGIPGGEFAPVTMSEVGTKLDLARAYMDMGDPEGARSILEEVVQEGSASQKKEATRLIQSLPG
jgi:pilus assembly protein FimV